jgi:hypothetical protein
MFVSVVSGFLWMTEKEFGFDPTIHETNGGRDTEITPDGQPQHFTWTKS